jgi:hypothetical protein
MTRSDGGRATGAAIVEAFVAGDAAAMTALLADDATFHSPVTDYRGRDRITKVLTALVQVVTDVRLTRALDGADSTAAFFTATADGRDGDGVLLVRITPEAPATELTLMIRPLATLLAGIERMKVLLGRDVV